MSDVNELAHLAFVCKKKMRLLYLSVMMKQVAFVAGSSTMWHDNILTNGLLDLLVMNFVSNTAFANSYTNHMYSLKTLKIKRINLS